MEHRLTLLHALTALTLAGSGVVIAVILRLGLHRLLTTGRASWTAGDVTVRALRGALPLAAAVGGLWLAEQQLPLNTAARGFAERALLAALILGLTIVGAGLAVDATRTFLFRCAGVVPSTTILANVVRLTVLLVGTLIMLESVGVSVTPLLGALGVGGLAVALALQDTLSNLFAGIQLLASRKIRPGHYVSLNSGQEGYVVDVNWRNTVIRQLPNNMVIVPNATLASQVVVNYHQPSRDMSVVLQVGVSYASDLEHVEQVTVDVAAGVMHDVSGGVPQHDPFVRYHTFGDSSIGFSVVLRAQEYTDQYLLTHEFMKRLHHRYQEEGIEIPAPIGTIVGQHATLSRSTGGRSAASALGVWR